MLRLPISVLLLTGQTAMGFKRIWWLSVLPRVFFSLKVRIKILKYWCLNIVLLLPLAFAFVCFGKRNKLRNNSNDLILNPLLVFLLALMPSAGYLRPKCRCHLLKAYIDLFEVCVIFSIYFFYTLGNDDLYYLKLVLFRAIDTYLFYMENVLMTVE